MGIGGALTEARTEAGLTIAQVSERTRIRETIIRGIERDDYSACGGDYYARGHIRAIARVVGTDPVPLIEEYDATYMPPPAPAELADDAGGHGWRLPSLQRIVGSSPGVYTNTHDGNAQSEHAGARDDADTSPDLYDPGALDFRAARRPSAGVPHGITAAEAFRPWMPLEPRRPLPRRAIALALVLLAVIGLLIYLLVSGGSSSASSHHGAVHHASGRHATHRPAGSGAATHTVSGPPTVPLTPVRAAAFGPGGVGQGDDPQQARLAVDGRESTAWQTDWYATAEFGALQSGTGLLLNMGKQVTVTSARILLGAAAGGSLQLRAGNTASLADLQVIARTHLPGGPLTLSIGSPVKARYLLIWFTRLPPDSSGTYRESIANVSLSGTT